MATQFSFDKTSTNPVCLTTWLVIGLMLVITQSLQATTSDSADQVLQKRLFAEPLTWVGGQRPPVVESAELLAVIEVFETNGPSAGFNALGKFLEANPRSPWTPSLQVNMAEHYRRYGNYSLALERWQLAWEATKDNKDANGQKIAVRAIAGWTRLLGSLGEKKQMEDLFAELDARKLPLGVYLTKIGETKEGLAMMNTKPGVSYRCGSFALGHMAMALGLDAKISRRLFEMDSPDGGFHMDQLLALAETNGMAVTAVRRPDGAELVVPSVMHLKVNHYVAITARQGRWYRVADPMLGREVWLDADTITAEASGACILLQDKVPAGWRLLTATECAAICGKGYPSLMDDTDDDGPPDGCPPDGDNDGEDSSCDPPAANDGASNGGVPQPPPCPDCGMPQWSVSEPYITLWLKDTPLLYRQSNGKWMRLTLSYKSRGETNGNLGGFGDKWSCNWIGRLQSQATNAGVAVNHLASGGQRSFATVGTPDYKTARRFAMVTLGVSDPPAIVAASGAMNFYGHAVGDSYGNTNYFLTRRIDQYGRLQQHFNYQTTGGLTLMTNVLDLDDRASTLTYGNTNFPNLITAVTDPYGRTAHFNYNSSGLLTNIVDVQGMPTYFQYDTDENITNMVTLYGTNRFRFFTGVDSNHYPAVVRSLLVTEPTGDHQLYAYFDLTPDSTEPISPYKLSYHWNRRQYQLISDAGKTNVLALVDADCQLASVKHWIHGDPIAGVETVIDTMDATAGPVDPAFGFRPWLIQYQYQGALKRVTDIYLPSGLAVDIQRNSLGRPTVFTYNNNGLTAVYSNFFDASGTILQYELGPRGELTRGYGYDPVITNLLVSVTNAVGDVLRYTHETGTLKVTSITFPGGMVRTNIYYASGPNQGFLQQQIDLGFRTNSFAYTNGNLWMQTNELGLVTTYAYDNLNRLTSTTYPDTTTVSNVYDKLDIVAVKDRLNQWTYYGYNPVRQLMAMTNVNGQVTTYDYCGCGAPDQITRWNGTTPLTTTFDYDIAGRLTNALYADGYQLGYAYNYNGQIQTVTDGAGNQLQLNNAQMGLQSVVYQALLGGQQLLNRQFDEYGRITNSIDRNYVATFQSYDFLDRLTTRQTVGNSGYGIQAGLESFVYDSRGLLSYTNQLGYPTTYGRDAAGRVLYQTNANNEVLQFTYNPADELLTLTDGKNQTTSWGYDSFGRVTSKLDAFGTNIFRYQYDANDRLTNRWSAAKGGTVYKYDPIGNLTNVVYLSGNTTNLVFRYDALNRLTNMVDGVGSTAFGWTDGDQLAGEDGPWANDTVTYSYNSARQRNGLSLLQPNASPWAQGYGYDTMMRLTSVVSPAGNFSYYYSEAADWAYYLRFKDNGSISAYNQVDGLARLTSTALSTPFASPASQFQYGYDEGSQRTQQVFTANNYINYTYDNIGQLKTAKGLESDGTTPRLHEQFGYAYDAAWNLNVRTNDALVQTFKVNTLNELTNATRSGTLTVAGDATERKGGYWDGYEWYWPGSPYGVTNVTVSGTGLSSGLAEIYLDGSWARTNATPANGANSYTAVAQDNYGRTDTSSVTVNLPLTLNFLYDLNGNLRTNNTRIYDYDDENQLIRVTEPGAWKSEYVYDGMMRRRITREYTWQSSAWVKTNEVRYVYDVNLVIQERDANNLPLVTYTRGNDLSGGLQEAGGIGGLLARTDNGLMIGGSPWTTAFYFCDGNGNVTTLVYTNGTTAAQYTYDPFGNTLTMSGPLAAANTQRFSSKEWCGNAGLYYYGYRFYDPNLQRWLNRDPLGDFGSLVYLTPSFTPNVVASDSDEASSSDFHAWIDVNGNLYGGVNFLNYVDPYGLCLMFWQKSVTVDGGTKAERTDVKKDLKEIRSTDRGKELMKQIRKEGKQRHIHLNDTGRLQGQAPGQDLWVDPNAHPIIQTTAGPQPASTLRIVAHELGHAVTGTGDTGPNNMDNVNQNENPIATQCGNPARTAY